MLQGDESIWWVRRKTFMGFQDNGQNSYTSKENYIFYNQQKCFLYLQHQQTNRFYSQIFKLLLLQE